MPHNLFYGKRVFSPRPPALPSRAQAKLAVKVMAYEISDMKVRFSGDTETVGKVNGQLLQDLWVLQMLDGRREGVYVEIGAHDPVHLSNTKLLEETFGWRGLGVEIDQDCWKKCRYRRNPVLLADATMVDYAKELRVRGLPLGIDYLSVDCEPATVTFEALKKALAGGVDPAIITFEHEVYGEGPEVRDESRAYLQGMGYQLIVGNVGIGEISFEDWYAHVDRVPAERREACLSLEEFNDAGFYMFGS